MIDFKGGTAHLGCRLSDIRSRWVCREFAARVGADAHKAQADLQAAQEQKGKIVITNTKLSQVCAVTLERAVCHLRSAVEPEADPLVLRDRRWRRRRLSGRQR